jgi:hypothetical protein
MPVSQSAASANSIAASARYVSRSTDTVRTSQSSRFGPLTRSKLRMWTSGQIAVAAQYAICAAATLRRVVPEGARRVPRGRHVDDFGRTRPPGLGFRRESCTSGARVGSI